jgi:hypothetical protein
MPSRVLPLFSFFGLSAFNCNLLKNINLIRLRVIVF